MVELGSESRNRFGPRVGMSDRWISHDCRGGERRSERRAEGDVIC
jgi:hypothetical protein